MGRARATVNDEKRGERLGRTIKRAREKTGMTQPQLAAKAGLGIDTFRRIEQGKRKDPSVFNVAAIANALGASLDRWIAKARGRR